MGAIVQLKVSDVYDPMGKVRDSITFAGMTRKSSKHGRANTRQIYIHNVLRHALLQYNAPPARTSAGLSPHRHASHDSEPKALRGEATSPPVSSSRYLFKSDRSSSGHITARSVDDYWRKILSEYGYRGFSTHSSRRWVINQLRSAGIEIVTIAETMAIDIATVRKYLDEDPVACRKAIATLSVIINSLPQVI